MDYATIRKLIESNGYKKVGTKEELISFTTNFLKGDGRISVDWRLGGYVKSITHHTMLEQKVVFNTALEFIQEFER